MRSSAIPDVVAIGFDVEGDATGSETISEEYTFRLHSDSNLGWGRPVDGTLETELLRRYLDKDHAFRTAGFRAENRALLDFALAGPLYPSPPSVPAAAWQNLTAMFGDAIDAQDNVDFDWRTHANTESYLWGYGGRNGGFWATGEDNSTAGVLDTRFLAENPSLVVFTEQFGSYSVDWSRTDGLLRAILANEGYGLTSTWGNWGDFDYYNMATGGTIGDSYLATQNRDADLGSNAVAASYTAIMGDPTLRMHIIAPPSNVSLEHWEDDVYRLFWGTSSDDILGYYVYKWDSGSERYIRENLNGGEPIQDDHVLVTSNGTDQYMVRAVKLEETPSGNYYNLSQGAFTDGVRLIAAVNAGGSAVSSLGNNFEADTSGSPSSHSNASSASSSPITPTSDPIRTSRAALSVPVGTNAALFQTARQDGSAGSPMEWNFGGLVNGARYAVRLYFAEIAANPGVGQRVFDVSIEGQTVLDDFDIYAEAGENTGIVKTFVVTAGSDGNLDIDFSKVSGTDEPLVSALEVYFVAPPA
jgi:hypothetical protein